MWAFGGALGNPDNLRFFARAADELGKPLFVGEIGYTLEVRRYDTEAALAMMRATLQVLVELKVPLTLYWQFSDDRGFEDSLSLRYRKTDAALALIEAASAEIRR